MAPTNDCLSASILASPIAEACRIHEVFNPSHSVVARTAPFVSVRLAVALFIAGGVLVAGASHLMGYAVSDALIIYTFIGLPLLLVGIYSRVSHTRQSQERTISLADGMITFASATEGESCSARECLWFYGKATDDAGLLFQNIRQKAILLVFPSGRTVACGLTSGFYAKWVDALREYYCRKVLRTEGALGALIGLLAIVGLVVGGWLGQQAGIALRDAVFRLAPNNQLANVFPVGLFILGLWCGGVSPYFIPGWRRYTESERQQFNRFAIGLPAKTAILCGAFMGGNVVASLILVLFFAALLLLLTRLVLR